MAEHGTKPLLWVAEYASNGGNFPERDLGPAARLFEGCALLVTDWALRVRQPRLFKYRHCSSVGRTAIIIIVVNQVRFGRRLLKVLSANGCK